MRFALVNTNDETVYEDEIPEGNFDEFDNAKAIVVTVASDPDDAGVYIYDEELSTGDEVTFKRVDSVVMEINTDDFDNDEDASDLRNIDDEEDPDDARDKRDDPASPGRSTIDD